MKPKEEIHVVMDDETSNVRRNQRASLFVHYCICLQCKLGRSFFLEDCACSENRQPVHAKAVSQMLRTVK